MSPKEKKRVDDGGASAGLRRYLYLTAAITGAAILIVEILGARMLSPFLGTSHFVWTAQISVTLISLAVGYYFGGWLVDKSADLKRIYVSIMAAAVYLSLTIGLTESVALGCLKFSLPVASVLASGFLFFVPLTLLAAVGPFFIRVLTSDLVSVGGQVGRLSAISTFGSVLGAILIGYVLIPLLPNSITMWSTSCVLFVVGIIYFVRWGARSNQAKAMGVSVVALLLGGAAARGEMEVRAERFEELYRGNSNFGYIQVWKDKDYGHYYYLNDRLTQNIYDPETKQSTTLFTYMLHGLSHVYAQRIERVLCIGLGVGIVPMQFHAEGVKIDVVEINPEIVEVGRRFFDLEPGQLNIILGDGRQVLNRTDGKYDVVILDAFLGDSSPSHLMTKEAFEGVRRVMEEDGVLVINSFGSFEPGRDFFTSSLYKTLSSVFRSVKIHHEGGGNVFFVASGTESLEMKRRPSLEGVHPTVVERARRAYDRTTVVNPESGMVLTDDYNPVEFRDAENREEVRRNLMRFFR